MVNMNNINGEYQNELFQEFQGKAKKTRFWPKFLQKRFAKPQIMVNLPAEKLILFSIIFLLSLIVTFAIGVEKGKRSQLSKARYVSVGPIASPTPPPGQLPQETVAKTGDVSKKINITAPPEPKKNILQATIQAAKRQSAISAPNVEKLKGPSSTGSSPARPLSNPYVIQLVAYKDKVSAQKKADELKSKGYEPFIIKGGDFFQVCVNNYSTKEQANLALKDFEKYYKGCFVRQK